MLDALGQVSVDVFHLIVALAVAFFVIRYGESKLNPEGATYKASKYLFH